MLSPVFLHLGRKHAHKHEHKKSVRGGGGVEYKHEREPSAYTYAFVAVMFSEDIVSIIIRCSLIGWWLICLCVCVVCIALYCTVEHIVSANLRAPHFLKIERLSHRVCMGDGGSRWWAPVYAYVYVYAYAYDNHVPTEHNSDISISVNKEYFVCFRVSLLNVYHVRGL